MTAQTKVVPAILLDNTMLSLSPVHMDCKLGVAVAVGVAGCALIVKGVEAERQPAAFCVLMPWGPTLIEAIFGEAENGSLSTL